MTEYFYGEDRYQADALRFENGMNKEYPRIFNAALGLCGEAGEFADLIKKWAFQGHELDTEHAARELGDICWYIALAADELGFALSDIFTMNISKLSARYPNGFDSEHSMYRADNDL